MNATFQLLETLLIVAAIGQLAVALMNLRLEKILKWEAHLAAMPDLVREVFVVHKWFISFTLLIFATMTIRFASDLAASENEIARWFGASVGIFWGIRTLMQWCYYGREHWRGKVRETAVHWVLTFVYAIWSGVYLFAAFQ